MRTKVLLLRLTTRIIAKVSWRMRRKPSPCRRFTTDPHTHTNSFTSAITSSVYAISTVNRTHHRMGLLVRVHFLEELTHHVQVGLYHALVLFLTHTHRPHRLVLHRLHHHAQSLVPQVAEQTSKHLLAARRPATEWSGFQLQNRRKRLVLDALTHLRLPVQHGLAVVEKLQLVAGVGECVVGGL